MHGQFGNESFNHFSTPPGYGVYGAGQPVTPSSQFRIASISKVLTAIGIMRLREEGKLDLGTKIFGPKGIVYLLLVRIFLKLDAIYLVKISFDLGKHNCFGFLEIWSVAKLATDCRCSSDLLIF